MFARRWIAYAAAGLLAIALVPAVSIAKSHTVKSAVAHKPLVKAAARKHVAHKHVKHASKTHKKVASKKPMHHKVHKKSHTHRKPAVVKKTTAVTVPPAPALRMF